MKAGFQKKGENKIFCFLVFFKLRIKNVKIGLGYSAVLRVLPLTGALNRWMGDFAFDYT